MAYLLEVYGLDDPVADESEYGVFLDTDMANLYRDLTARGELVLHKTPFNDINRLGVCSGSH